MNKTLLYSIVIVIVVVLFAAAMLYTTGYATTLNLAAYAGKPVPENLQAMLNVPDNLSNAIGMGAATSYFVKIKNATPLTADRKPEVLYIGAEYCPFCAAERWALIIALLRFGNFTNLKFMTSSASDYSPSTATFTFVGANYTSKYISFIAVETETNAANPQPLQQPTQAEQSMINLYDPGGSIPFLLIANSSFENGANFDPYSVLYGKNWSVIAKEIHNASSLQAEAIIGSANLLTEQICKADNYTPQSVCAQQYISRISRLPILKQA